jgi:hypothetical protein
MDSFPQTRYITSVAYHISGVDYEVYWFVLVDVSIRKSASTDVTAENGARHWFATEEISSRPGLSGNEIDDFRIREENQNTITCWLLDTFRVHTLFAEWSSVNQRRAANADILGFSTSGHMRS